MIHNIQSGLQDSEKPKLTDFSDNFQNVAILQEECNEVVHIGFKIMRFGFDSWHPDDPTKTNKDLLTQEVGDILAMVDILKANGILDADELQIAKSKKFRKLEKFYTFPKGE